MGAGDLDRGRQARRQGSARAPKPEKNFRGSVKEKEEKNKRENGKNPKVDQFLKKRDRIFQIFIGTGTPPPIQWDFLHINGLIFSLPLASPLIFIYNPPQIASARLPAQPRQ